MKIFVLCVALLSSNVFAAQSAKVILVRGKVTKLAPGHLKAKSVKRGDTLVEDTSILTGEKSFVKLRFADKSTMNLGSKSMVVINKMPEKKANMVNLLTGMLKAEVKKKTKKESKTKLIIKTRTAVMGVRGTKFQTMYNSTNKSTSLVTVEGKVAMVKKETITKKIAEVKKTQIAKIAKQNNLPTEQVEIIPKKNDLSEVDAIEKAFEDSADIVEVSEGRYSGITNTTAKPTVPVKIAPKQYNAIAKSMGSKKKAVDVMKVSKFDPKPEGFKDITTNTVLPKSGGIIDFSTGLYVAPSETAELDKVTGTFTADKEIGKVNEVTGDYIPPKGIKIDANKGFVIDTKESAKLASTEDKAQLKRTVAKMNKGAEKQIVVNKMKTTEKSSPKWKWLPKNHILSAQLKPFSEILTVKNKENNSEADFYTDKANWVILTWKQQWNEKWNSRMRIGGQSYEIDDSDVKVYEYGDDDKDDGYFSLGVSYIYSHKLELFADFVNKGLYYVVPTNGSNGSGVEIRTRDVDSLDIGFEYGLTSWRAMDVKIFGTLSLMGNSSAPAISSNEFDHGEEDSEFFGFNVGASSYYSWKKNMGVKGSLWYDRMNTNNSELEFTRNTFGFGADFIWDI
jgi:hypothetical protein